MLVNRHWCCYHATLCCVGIDRAGPDYIYQQLADDLRKKIRAGKLTGKLPPLPELEDEYGVASMTVRRALRILEAEGLVRIVPGRGSFVI